MIQLKGKVAGMLQCIVPDNIEEEEILRELGELASAGKKLLEGNSVVMDMKGRAVSFDLMEKICRTFVNPSGSKVISWIILDADSHEMFKRAGLSLGEPNVKALVRGKYAFGSQQGFLFTGTLRGGQRIEHDGDVIVAGHANTGSEILATGHVVVLGWLKGLVHAGCSGNNNMSVSARSLESGQVRIGDRVGLINRSSLFWGKPCVVTVVDKEVLIAEWPVV